MGGWEGDFFDDPSSGDDALQRIVERMASLEQTARVGEMWGYNNAGFYLAGRIIEVVTGKPFERELRELVLDPVGLEQIAERDGPRQPRCPRPSSAMSPTSSCPNSSA